ncbi:C-C motif chemokine 4-like [Cottoperca gobio]|uniref:C-C motif chemokine 4-like n=1 Tax=Cottoperca gobio TaxID=56716 RepID=A0A6J2P7V7_COTGO|nr:C-C motif chemokine 4-like [Cottoperca gobio]
MMMKNRIILVTCVVLFSSLAVLAHQGSFGPDECCLNFVIKRLRKNNVVSHKYTDRRCKNEGVIFTMKSGNEICADPSVKWVKNLVKAKPLTN